MAARRVARRSGTAPALASSAGGGHPGALSCRARIASSARSAAGTSSPRRPRARRPLKRVSDLERGDRRVRPDLAERVDRVGAGPHLAVARALAERDLRQRRDGGRDAAGPERASGQLDVAGVAVGERRDEQLGSARVGHRLDGADRLAAHARLREACGARQRLRVEGRARLAKGRHEKWEVDLLAGGLEQRQHVVVALHDRRRLMLRACGPPVRLRSCRGRSDRRSP